MRARSIEPAAPESSLVRIPPSVFSILRRGAVAGTLASVLSTLVIARRSQIDSGNPYCGTNATSHWIWGERALHRKGLSVRYTLVGYLIHHFCSTFWATIFMAWRSWRLARSSQVGSRKSNRESRPPESASMGSSTAAASATQRQRDVGEALVMGALAAAVDYTITPYRLRPGYERHLRRRSLTGVYLMFGLGLAAGTCCLDRLRCR